MIIIYVRHQVKWSEFDGSYAGIDKRSLDWPLLFVILPDLWQFLETISQGLHKDKILKLLFVYFFKVIAHFDEEEVSKSKIS